MPPTSTLFPYTTLFRSGGFFRPARRSRDRRPAHLAKRPRRREADAWQSVCLGGREVQRIAAARLSFSTCGRRWIADAKRLRDRSEERRVGEEDVTCGAR